MRILEAKDCAINTATLGFQAPIGEVIEAIARHGFAGIAPWRREMEGQNLKPVAKHIRDSGLQVTGYCRSTYIPANTRAEFTANIEDNKLALDDAAELGAQSFVMVVGTLRDLSSARAQVREGVAMLLEHAQTLNVKLALEPLHPVYAADRSCITLAEEALDMCDAIEGSVANPQLGIFLDAYHLWWSTNLQRDIKRAGKDKRIFGFHVSDWLNPTIDILNDRGMMGDGVIDLKSMRQMVEAAGYHGLIETEIFSSNNWWKKPMDETLRVVQERIKNSV
jgi:sugar phosphate isomerase/epimerase